MSVYYPIMLMIQDRNCIVIGGGSVAYRKALSLMACHGNVTIISPALSGELQQCLELGQLQWICREYTQGDLQEAYLVYGATDDAEVNQAVYEEAQQRQILVNIVDQPALCNFIVPAVVQQGDLTISVSTNGRSPMLARKIRQQLEEQFGEHYGRFIRLLGNLRKEMIERIPKGEVRAALYEQLVYSDLLERLKDEEEEFIQKEIQLYIDQYSSINDFRKKDEASEENKDWHPGK